MHFHEYCASIVKPCNVHVCNIAQAFLLLVRLWKVPSFLLLEKTIGFHFIGQALYESLKHEIYKFITIILIG